MRPAYSESGREGVGDVRADPRPTDLQHDLRVAGERDGGWIAVPPVAIDVCGDPPAIAREAVSADRLTPDAEQVAEGPAGAGDLEHASRLAGHDGVLAGSGF